MSTSLSDAYETLGRRGTFDGMRREWNFSLTFVHQAARVVLQLSHQWEITFIDPRDIEQLNRLDRDVKHCPMMPALRYTDLSAVMKPNNELWTEIPKHVSIMYSHIPPDMTLAAYCVWSVQHILSDPHVVSIDGSTDLLHLRLGNKLRCPHRLGGHRSFCFRYQVSFKSKLINDVVYAIGTIINQRGYLCTVQCSEEEELEGYVTNNFLSLFTNPDKFGIDQDVAYEELASTILKEQQKLFGELRYFDADAAVAFSIPMHPMRMRPDFSPTQTVGVGSIACMTLELNVYQKVIEDFAEADITGMPKYKINPVVLFLDVEDVARMGYPRIISTEEYSQLKTKRLFDIFGDAKLVGTPVTNNMGIRVGRSRSVTLTYEPLNAVVKLVMVSAIVGSVGVSAVFLTKLGGGVFDAHLYLHQHLIKSIKFFEKATAKLQFSRYRVVNVRLMEQNIPRVYCDAPVDERQMMERHIKFLRMSNDGRVEGAVAILVPPEEGGLERHQQCRRQGRRGTSQTLGETAAARLSAGSSNSFTANLRGSGSYNERILNELIYEEEGSMDFNSNDSLDTRNEGSFHSDSLISVTSIARLQDMAPYDNLVYTHVSEAPLPFNSAAITPIESVNSVVTVSSTAPPQAPLQPPPPPPPPPPPQQGLQTDMSSVVFVETVERDATCASSPSTVDRPTVFFSSTVSVGGDAGDCAADAGVVLLPAQQLSDEKEEEQQRQFQLQFQELSKDEADVYFGPSLHDIYVRSCEMQRCRPNSYLLKKLPTNPRFTGSVRELDLSFNYLGQNGFMAMLNLIEHLPKLRTLYFDDMSLSNVDVKNLCEVLAENHSVRAVYLRNNSKITLPATRYFTRLLEANENITVLSLEGTRLGAGVIKKLEQDVMRNASKRGGDSTPKDAALS